MERLYQFNEYKSICMMTGLGTAFIKNYLTLIVILLYKISYLKVHKVIFQNKDDKQKFIDLGITSEKNHSITWIRR